MDQICLKETQFFSISFGFFNQRKNRVWVILKRFLKFHTVRNVQEEISVEEKNKNKIGTWASGASNCFVGCYMISDENKHRI